MIHFQTNYVRQTAFSKPLKKESVLIKLLKVLSVQGQFKLIIQKVYLKIHTFYCRFKDTNGHKIKKIIIP